MSQTTHRPFTTLSSQVVWECPWYRVRRDDILLPNGTRGEYNTVEKADAVWVLPLTSDGRVPLLRHYRYTIDEWCWEIPAGSVKPGQTAEEAALEELHEEVGGAAAEIAYVSRVFMANGICNEVGHIYFASGVTLGEVSHEPAEVIEVHLLPAAAVLAMAQRGEISDGPSALAVLLCADKLSAGLSR